MVMDLQAFREDPHRCRSFLRQTFDREKHLVLLRLQTRLACGFLAEPEKTPDLITQLGQGSVIVHANFPRVHYYLVIITSYRDIVSRYIILAGFVNTGSEKAAKRW